MTALEKIKQADVLLQEAIKEMEGTTPPTPPTVTKVVEVTVDRANIRCIRSTNVAGRIVAMIYPEDSAPVKQRIQFKKGFRVQVHPKMIIADGGERFYELKDPVFKDNVLVSVRLFIKEEDIKVV